MCISLCMDMDKHLMLDQRSEEDTELNDHKHIAHIENARLKHTSEVNFFNLLLIQIKRNAKFRK